MIASILFLSCSAATVAATARPVGGTDVAFLSSSSSSLLIFPRGVDRRSTTTTIIVRRGMMSGDGRIPSPSRRRRRRPWWSSSTSLSGKNKYAVVDDKTADGDDDDAAAAIIIDERRRQRELLFDLESRLDYDGRISSRVITSTATASASEASATNNDDDEKINDEEDDDDMPTAATIMATTRQPRSHRCGLITILGMPNMGKSTLLNALLDDELAIVNPRPQTTRHAILGVMTHDDTQLCLTDTPGLICNPAYKMQEGMMGAVRSSVRDADVYLVVTDVYSGRGYDNWGEGGVEGRNDNNNDINDRDDEEGGEGMMGIGTDMLNRLRTSGRPVIVCVNKVDLVTTAATAAASSSSSSSGNNDINNTPTRAAYTIQKWRSMLPNAFAILPTCASNGPNDVGVVALRSILLANEVDMNIDVGASIRALGRPVPGMFPINNHDSDAIATTTTMPILKSSSLSFDERCKEIIPIGPPLYHSDFFTDRTDRFCASELIRGVLFTSLGKELPYCCEVRVETFDESRRYVDNDDGTNSDDYDDEDDDNVRDNVDCNDDNNNNNDDFVSNTKKNKAGLIRIGATILVERDSQKGIVVGKGGIKIRDVGIAARKILQDFFGCKVILDLRVKVDKNWRNDVDKLKKYGYMQ